MTNYEISILKYRHSYELGEEVNIGALLLNVDLKEVRFIYPSKLQRLSNLYSDLSLNFIKRYLRDFESHTKVINKRFNEINSFKSSIYINELGSTNNGNLLFQIIDKEFLKNDSASFFFSEPINGVTKSFDSIYEYYSEKINKLYSQDSGRDRKDEDYIIKNLDKEVSKNNLLSKSFERDIVIENDFFKEEFKFGWKNGRFNLITPVSFDYAHSKTIDDKACKWHGKLDSFKDQAFVKNLNFDIVVTYPEDKSLIKHYKNAIKFLETLDAPKRIIENNTISAYLSEASEYLS